MAAENTLVAPVSTSESHKKKRKLEEIVECNQRVFYKKWSVRIAKEIDSVSRSALTNDILVSFPLSMADSKEWKEDFPKLNKSVLEHHLRNEVFNVHAISLDSYKIDFQGYDNSQFKVQLTLRKPKE